MDYEPTPEQLKGYTLKDSGKPHRRIPTCTDYVECHDKNWDKGTREYWKIKSDESIQHILTKYRPSTSPDAPESTQPKKWYPVPSTTKESR